MKIPEQMNFIETLKPGGPEVMQINTGLYRNQKMMRFSYGCWPQVLISQMFCSVRASIPCPPV